MILPVFIGKPGSGKSTLIKATFSEYMHVDVRPFVKAFEVNGIVPEEKTVLGYQNMYKFLDEEIEKQKEIVLELGTNHEELNIEKLIELNSHSPIHIFLCDASADTCRVRVMNRLIKPDPEALERRLERNFPTSHLNLLKNTKLSYVLLNMEEPIEENIKKVQENMAL